MPKKESEAKTKPESSTASSNKWRDEYLLKLNAWHNVTIWVYSSIWTNSIIVSKALEEVKVMSTWRNCCMKYLGLKYNFSHRILRVYGRLHFLDYQKYQTLFLLPSVTYHIQQALRHQRAQKSLSNILSTKGGAWICWYWRRIWRNFRHPLKALSACVDKNKLLCPFVMKLSYLKYLPMDCNEHCECLSPKGDEDPWVVEHSFQVKEGDPAARKIGREEAMRRRCPEVLAQLKHTIAYFRRLFSFNAFSKARLKYTCLLTTSTASSVENIHKIIRFAFTSCILCSANSSRKTSLNFSSQIFLLDAVIPPSVEIWQKFDTGLLRGSWLSFEDT